MDCSVQGFGSEWLVFLHHVHERITITEAGREITTVLLSEEY